MKQEGEFMQDFTLNLSREELEKRTSKDYLNTKKMLSPNAAEYHNLRHNTSRQIGRASCRERV